MKHPTFQFQDTETLDTDTLVFASWSLVEQFKLENLYRARQNNFLKYSNSTW